ncbi:MAG: S8 family peptidase [Bacteroidales bacterium]|nr:S8 family peptidase [Bacteroidales bacterium]
MRKYFLFVITCSIWPLTNILAAPGITPADSAEFYNWFNLDMQNDSIPGISTEKAYDQLLKNKNSTIVVVAVIDGGVDINHEDLKGKIWTNEDEIPGNGIDDDQNGFVDDVHGWNFLGGKNGENIEQEAYEVTRIYRKYKDVFGSSDTLNLKGKDLETFYLYKKARKIYYEKLNKALEDMALIQKFEAGYLRADSIIKSTLNKDTFSLEELKATGTSENMEFAMARMMIVNLNENGFKIETLNNFKKHVNTRLNYHFNLDFNPRTIVNDDPENPADSIYGNNDIIANTPEHGTFVSGIIAGNRNNNIGMQGIADNVKIMAIRAVPDGDERDKDIANAIKYAVNNGAHIINMSFGKDLSPQKELVDEAIRYARAHDVLLVHAAGNDGEDVDKNPRHPNSKTTNGELLSSHWICVGASAKSADLNFAGSFSNYGRKSVDLFAPGVNIYSLKPDNRYDVLDGTSFAAPMVAGTAALLKSYFPEFTATEIKDIILASAENYKKQKVTLPSKDEEKKKKKTRFGKLSSTGGLLNVYNAVEMCD